MRTLWPRWTLLPAAPFVLWCSYLLLVRGEARWELVAILIGAPLLAYASQRTKKLFVGWLPFMLVGLLYDAMRFVQDWGVSASTVHVCDLRAYELSLFGSYGRGPGGGPGTLHDWLQAHASTFADAYFAIPYGSYIFVALGYGVYLAYTDHAALQRYGWAFFVLNIAGFVTYHLYPAAPPWYFHAHGCGVDLTATASEGANLARVDRLLGIGYFHGLYGRSHDVFGAVPSLHVTYPVLMAWVGWPRHRWPVRALMLVYAASMIAGAIYLDHHWILDVVIGLSFVAVIYPATVAVLGRRGQLAVLAPTPIAPDLSQPAPAPARRPAVLEPPRESVQP
jgi:membrane-associated phospholipid phosphatase